MPKFSPSTRPTGLGSASKRSSQIVGWCRGVPTIDRTVVEHVLEHHAEVGISTLLIDPVERAEHVDMTTGTREFS